MPEATEAEIDAQIEELRNYYTDFKDANANTKVKQGEFVELTIKATRIKMVTSSRSSMQRIASMNWA